jgi:hypothetical protein
MSFIEPVDAARRERSEPGRGRITAFAGSMTYAEGRPL